MTSYGLLSDMGEDVQPAAMGHAHDDFLDAQRSRRHRPGC